MTPKEPASSHDGQSQPDAEHWQHCSEWVQRASDPAFRVVQGVALIVTILLTAAWAFMASALG